MLFMEFIPNRTSKTARKLKLKIMSLNFGDNLRKLTRYKQIFDHNILLTMQDRQCDSMVGKVHSTIVYHQDY